MVCTRYRCITGLTANLPHQLKPNWSIRSGMRKVTSVRTFAHAERLHVLTSQHLTVRLLEARASSTASEPATNQTKVRDVHIPQYVCIRNWTRPFIQQSQMISANENRKYTYREVKIWIIHWEVNMAWFDNSTSYVSIEFLVYNTCMFHLNDSTGRTQISKCFLFRKICNAKYQGPVLTGQFWQPEFSLMRSNLCGL